MTFRRASASTPGGMVTAMSGLLCGGGGLAALLGCRLERQRATVGVDRVLVLEELGAEGLDRPLVDGELGPIGALCAHESHAISPLPGIGEPSRGEVGWGNLGVRQTALTRTAT